MLSTCMEFDVQCGLASCNAVSNRLAQERVAEKSQ
jgi:hypothetical protein